MSTSAISLTSRSPSGSVSPPPSDDMASVMGFASFGHKPNPPKKKRKLLDPTNEGSGTNNTPLGVRSRRLASQSKNLARDEGLDGSGDQVELVEDQNGDIDRADVTGTDGYSRKRETAEIDSVAKRGIAGANDREIETIDAGRLHQLPKRLSQPGLETGVVAEECDVPPKMAAAVHDQAMMASGSKVGRMANGQWDWGALNKGIRVERGDIAYYRQSFVEDPWRKLRGGDTVKEGG